MKANVWRTYYVASDHHNYVAAPNLQCHNATHSNFNKILRTDCVDFIKSVASVDAAHRYIDYIYQDARQRSVLGQIDRCASVLSCGRSISPILLMLISLPPLLAQRRVSRHSLCYLQCTLASYHSDQCGLATNIMPKVRVAPSSNSL